MGGQPRGAGGDALTGMDRTFHNSVSVGATTTAVLATEDRARVYVLLQNDSDEVIYVSLGAPAVQNTGIRLNASGGSYEMSARVGNLWLGEIHAICASGTKNLLVTEGY